MAARLLVATLPSFTLVFASQLGSTCAGDASTCGDKNRPRESLLLQVEHLMAKRSSVGARKLPELPDAYTAPDADLVQAPQWHASKTSAGLVQWDSPSAEELEHFQMVKDLRVKGFKCKSKYFPGIPDTEDTFKFDCRLWRAARDWSSEMGKGDFFAHKHGGSDPCQRTRKYGLTACAENIAAGNPSASTTLEQWKKSDGHCLNMMDPKKNRFAVGYVSTPKSRYTDYWTQSLGNNAGEPDQSCLSGAGENSPEGQSLGMYTEPPSSPPRGADPSCTDENPHCENHYAPYCNFGHIKRLCKKTCNQCNK